MTTGNASNSLRLPGGAEAVLREVKTAAGAQDPARAWKAAKKVEVAFLGMLVKEMRKTVESGGLMHGGMGEEIFQGELDSAYVNSVESAPGAGIARIYFEQLMRRNSADAAKARAKTENEFMPLKKDNPAIPLQSDEPAFLPLDRSRFEERFIALKDGQADFQR